MPARNSSRPAPKSASSCCCCCWVWSIRQSELTTNLRQQAPAGLANIVANATPGALIGVLLGWPLPAVVAMAGVTYATSSGITAKVLSDLGRLGNRETPVVLSLLVLEDLSMALYLPVLTAMLAGVSFLAGAISVSIALVAISVALLIALRFGRALGRFVFSENREVLLLIVFGLALLVAGIAQRLQVSEAVGAFLVGIALSGRVAESVAGRAGSAAGPVRRGLLRVLRPAHRPGRHPADAAARDGPGRGHRADQDRGRHLGRPAGEDRPWPARSGPAPRSCRAASSTSSSPAWPPAPGIVAPGFAALAAAYVLILAITGPLIARAGEPLGRAVARRVTARRERREQSIRDAAVAEAADEDGAVDRERLTLGQSRCATR